MSDPYTPIEVFYSYTREDELHRRRLVKHLSLLHRQGLISSWHDRQIIPGTDWAQTIDTKVNRALVILLLVSPDFLSSDYCYEAEMKRALERHKAREARVIPILLRPVDNWRSAPFGRLRVLPSNEKPVTKWRNRDEAFADIAEGIRKALEDIQCSKKRNEHRLLDKQPIHNTTTHKIINTHEAISLFDELMQDNAQKRIFCLVGGHNMGKSHLLRHILSRLTDTNWHSEKQSLSEPVSESADGDDATKNASWYEQDHPVRCALVDLDPKHCSTVPAALSQAYTQLGTEYFSDYKNREREWMNRRLKTDVGGPEVSPLREENEARYLTFHFIDAISMLTNQRILLLFDSIEQAESTMRQWLMNDLLISLSRLKHIRVVLAGHSLPGPQGSYQAHCLFYQLLPIKKIDEYLAYCEQRNLKLSKDSIHTLAHAFEYIPGSIVKVLSRFTDQEWSNG